MSAPMRIQRSRAKGWRMPPNTVSVTRPGPWGNPFRVGQPTDKRLLGLWMWTLKRWMDPCADAAEAVRRFRACIASDDASHHAARGELRGKNLACYCAPGEPCHADVLLEIANR